MSMTHRLAEILKPAVDLIYPPRCPLCGDGIAEQKGVCACCWDKIIIPGSPACTACQRPIIQHAETGPMQCASCLQQPPLHDGIAAGTLYNDASRQLVLALKHGRKIALAPMMARLMVARLPAFTNQWICAPVPLHRSRLWLRGFNQAALLATEISRMTGHTLVVDALTRVKPTRPLGGLGRRDRARAISGAIAINQKTKSKINRQNIILIDDVLTSGATSDACIAALKRNGANQVLICCFSRVLNDAGILEKTS